MSKNDDLIFVTGAAGFIGAALSLELLKKGFDVVGIDNLNSYYDVNLKEKRIQNIEESSFLKKNKWKFFNCNIADDNQLSKLFKKFKPSIVVNLAAQAGVRYSLKFPKKYIESNLVGFSNILENCAKNNVNHLVYASSSSVYGGNTNLPFSEEQSVDHPVSLYAATKKSNELMAHAYSHIHNLPATGLRFFTVYGPWGRPDMAPMIFAKSILQEEPIEVFNYGEMQRDFTFIEDIVQAIFKCCFKPATINPLFDSCNPSVATSFAPHRIFNIGNSSPVKLLKFIDLLEYYLDKKAIKVFKPMLKVDVKETYANITSLDEWIGFKPKTSFEKGIKIFANWYIKYYSEIIK
tara:strand:- start:6855 stop:7901 length:1047 start_codon:yes stop_codon:yes gene_type:complete